MDHSDLNPFMFKELTVILDGVLKDTRDRGLTCAAACGVKARRGAVRCGGGGERMRERARVDAAGRIAARRLCALPLSASLSEKPLPACLPVGLRSHWVLKSRGHAHRRGASQRPSRAGPQKVDLV